MALNLLERRIRMMPGFVQTFAGIPVLMDGKYFTKYNAAMNARIESNPDYFIAGWFDTGSTSSKKYDLYVPSGTPDDVKLRFYNDTSGTSVDYWTVESRVFTSAGRFVLVSVYKPLASSVYMKLYDSGIYLFKGSSVL